MIELSRSQKNHVKLPVGIRVHTSMTLVFTVRSGANVCAVPVHPSALNEADSGWVATISADQVRRVPAGSYDNVVFRDPIKRVLGSASIRVKN